ncbi:Type II restriction modification system N4-cytosine or N6-adenine DNA methyltransferase [Metamycoplasma alkalescens 14918]|uniref:Methyltransferase n=1 Tax=Metamycoplasma alkalescens 14918 TaxID=1188234 RepID=N9SRL3_9BACT|nr:site-specific DNA-methyltransferase [Metamycoplasma alkalescens]ENY54100.1 Type II restriction modification system N4-cytosine or N6-adenine DNA methyltransferase [Metamycoplasma alkalescens 14918]
MIEVKNKILYGDCIENLKKIPDETFDFCFADPPYFMQIERGKKLFRVDGTEFNGCDDEWDKFESITAYKKWTKQWLTEVHRVLKKDGSICVIAGMQSIFEIGSILREIGYWVINDIIWHKSNPTPNFGGTRLNNSHETLIWATKTKKSKFTFNYKTGKFLNGGKQMGSIWKFSVCSGNERLKDYNGKKVHNTQKPEALLYRIITLFTKKDDLILDPFGGTMTTAYVAKKTGRNYTMIERDPNYIKHGQKRIDSAIPSIGDVENAIFDLKPPKVQFSKMVEANYFNIGEPFYTKNKEKALLNSKNGHLKYNAEINSMHEIAGKMIGLDRRVNAFNYLYVIRDDELISINQIRNKYRAKLKEDI